MPKNAKKGLVLFLLKKCQICIFCTKSANHGGDWRVSYSDALGPGPKPKGPTGFLASPKKPEPDIPGPRLEIVCINMFFSKN